MLVHTANASWSPAEDGKCRGEGDPSVPARSRFFRAAESVASLGYSFIYIVLFSMFFKGLVTL